jgi:hypothetical protein
MIVGSMGRSYGLDVWFYCINNIMNEDIKNERLEHYKRQLVAAVMFAHF